MGIESLGEEIISFGSCRCLTIFRDIILVPSVITDVFSQQTGADPELNLFDGQCLLISKTRNEKRRPSLVLQIFKTESLLQFLFFDKFDID